MSSNGDPLARDASQVTVYVAPGCAGCDLTFTLVGHIVARLGRPELVKVIDVSTNDAEVPEDLFAVPSWYVDGVRFSLGNPTEEEFITALTRVDKREELQDEAN